MTRAAALLASARSRAAGGPGRVVALTAVLVALSPHPAAAQTSCGGLLQPACTTAPAPTTPPPATPPPAAPAPAPAPAPEPVPAPPLSPERFAAYDELLEASVGFYADKPTRAQRARFKRACAALDPQDPLLLARRRLCLVEPRLDLIASAFDRCSGRRCAGPFVRAARVLRLVADRFQALDAQVGAAVRDPACRAVLRSPRGGIRYVRQGARAFDHAAAALRSGSLARLRASQRELATIPEPKTDSARVTLRTFRRDCQ